MNRNYQILCLAVAMLASGAANAATVIETVPSTITVSGPNTQTFGFAEVVNANQFVSASGGLVTVPEGGNFSVVVNYVDKSSFSLFSATLPFNSSFNLSSIAATAIPLGTINGLTFTFGLQNFVQNLTIPAGTTFTFGTTAAAVPEPASWAMMLMGFAAIGYGMRRRRDRLAIAA